MTSEVESAVVGAASEGGGGVVGGDPHANIRVDRFRYLEILENGGYDISYHQPKEIPEGVVVEADPVHACKKGLRHFRVRKRGFDTFDLVVVGTITIQNGFAYVAGSYVQNEVPEDSNEYALIPPFAISYPIHPTHDLNKKEMAEKVHKHLKEQVTKYCFWAPSTILDIDLTRRYSLEQENLCQKCGYKMYRGGIRECLDCRMNAWVDKLDEGRGGDEVETHKDTNVEDDDDDHGPWE